MITLIGDPSSLPSGTWRAARLGSKLTNKRLKRKKALFLSYLMTLALIFIATLIKGKYPLIEMIIEISYLFFSFFAFIASFMLPSALIDMQSERIEQEIASRKEAAGIKEGDDDDEM